jgi:hypothetical protein
MITQSISQHINHVGDIFVPKKQVKLGLVFRGGLPFGRGGRSICQTLMSFDTQNRNLDNPGRLEGWKIAQYLPAFQSSNLPGFIKFGCQTS